MADGDGACPGLGERRQEGGVGSGCRSSGARPTPSRHPPVTTPRSGPGFRRYSAEMNGQNGRAAAEAPIGHQRENRRLEGHRGTAAAGPAPRGCHRLARPEGAYGGGRGGAEAGGADLPGARPRRRDRALPAPRLRHPGVRRAVATPSPPGTASRSTSASCPSSRRRPRSTRPTSAVEDADALAEESRRPRAPRSTAREDTEWGQHEGAVVDPDGNVIRFGSPMS